MVVIRNQNSIEGRRQGDLARAISERSEFEPVTSQLMKVVSYAVLSAGNYRWTYTVRRAQVGTAAGGYGAAVTSDTQQETALSVSELSNAAAYIAYGVDKTHIPAGFAPQPIPVNTYVMCVPHRLTDGTLIWLIINTQAIDGVCS